MDIEKFLPISNPDLLDHINEEYQFLNSYNSGRLPHAWLICGPRGIGKATLAYRISRFLLSRNEMFQEGNILLGKESPQEGVTNLATNITESVCRRIISGGHSDFLKIERSINEKTGKRRNEIRINEVREAVSFLSKTPAEGRWRVIVIDSADELNPNAANAILKILEEPPKNAILLLVSHNPGRLLPTIRSRCRRLRLNSLSKDTIRTLLCKYSSGMTAKDAQKLAEVSDGSIGLALELSERGGLEIYGDINDILKSLPQLDIALVHQFSDKINRDTSGEKFETTFYLINRWLVDIIKRAAINKDSSLDPWIQVWDNTTHLLNTTKRVNLEPKQVILNTFIAIKSVSNL